MPDKRALLLTPAEVAEAIRLSRQSTYKLIQRGAIPSIRLSGGRIRVRFDALNAWIDAQKEPRREGAAEEGAKRHG